MFGIEVAIQHAEGATARQTRWSAKTDFFTSTLGAILASLQPLLVSFQHQPRCIFRGNGGRGPAVQQTKAVF
jgi:hypothetical protein